MNRKLHYKYIITVVLFFIALSLGLIGCDMFKQEVPPDQLPPIPEECIPLSHRYEELLRAAYSSVEASQTQVSLMAVKFSQCMEDAGLTKGETKGIIKELEKSVRQEVEKGGSAGDLWPR